MPREPAPVYAIVGTDAFMQRQSLERILAQVGPDVQRTDIEGASAEPAQLFDELDAVAMFGGRRMVVVREAELFIARHRDLLEQYLQRPPGANVLVLRCASLPKNQRVYKLIAKGGEVIGCDPPRESDLPRWIRDQAKRAHGLSVDAETARLLADLIGLDLGSLDNELAKLVLAAEGGRVVPEMVAGGVAFRREQQMWAMTDALTAGRPGESLRIWGQLLATDSSAEFRAVTWLAIWLEKATAALSLAAEGRDPREIARELRVWPAGNVEPLLRTARSLGRGGLRRMIDDLAELDYRIKSGLGSAGRGVEEFIASAALAGARA